MELINYLSRYFLTKQELLTAAKITEQELSHYQQLKVMPKCSYKLQLSVASTSFFGLHNEEQEIEYYAKGYISWLAIAQSLNDTKSIYSLFVSRYKATIEQLRIQGHYSTNDKINASLDLHLKDEWQHFLDGIYGLCTKSGLPEDIAAKEFSILEINELTANTELTELAKLTEQQLSQLTRAVNLLDSVSALFAPHERLKSSRHRLVDEVRRKYVLLS
ncbi:MAG: hypothetical protein HRT53_01750 [Colwellia sp.]|nr:hypothetical protein [Colwellia sp.]